MITLRFAKLKDGAVIPSKRREDAGYDIYACLEGKTMIIPPHRTVLVPTGLASVIPEGYYIQLEERGSTGSKGIKRSAGVIDSGYRDEWFVALTNTNRHPIILLAKDDKRTAEAFPKCAVVYPETKAICQAVVHEVIDADTEEISKDELSKYKSERGTTKLGQSGK